MRRRGTFQSDRYGLLYGDDLLHGLKLINGDTGRCRGDGSPYSGGYSDWIDGCVDGKANKGQSNLPQRHIHLRLDCAGEMFAVKDIVEDADDLVVVELRFERHFRRSELDEVRHSEALSEHSSIEAATVRSRLVEQRKVL